MSPIPGATLMSLLMFTSLNTGVCTWSELVQSVVAEANGGLSERRALHAGDFLERVECGARVVVLAGSRVLAGAVAESLLKK